MSMPTAGATEPSVVYVQAGQADGAAGRPAFSKDKKSFVEEFKKRNPKVNLETKCSIILHEYGEEVYFVNGKEVGASNFEPITINSVKELLERLPDLALPENSDHQAKTPPADEWTGRAGCHVRWIDVESMNGDVIQHLLRLVDCYQKYTFNNIVDTRQRAMGLVLDGPEDDTGAKFLLVTKLASLHKLAREKEEAQESGANLYDAKTIVDYEHISYLLDTRQKVVGKPSMGTLISIQEGKEGDVFEEVRARLLKPKGRFRKRGVSYLLNQLVRASNEAAVSIEHYMGNAIEQLTEAMANKPTSLELSNKARLIATECETLNRYVTPFAEVLSGMTSEGFPKSILGQSVPAWNDIKQQQRRLVDNITGEQLKAQGLVEGYRDIQAKKMERNSFAMSLVLAIFSPLSFISGIYGMNFDGTIPELTWNRESSVSMGITGYEYFWILIGVVVTAILLAYVAAGLITLPCTRG